MVVHGVLISRCIKVQNLLIQLGNLCSEFKISVIVLPTHNWTCEQNRYSNKLGL